MFYSPRSLSLRFATLVDATGTNTQSVFLEAMQEIRGVALSCSFAIPQPTVGGLDYDKVNVDHRQHEHLARLRSACAMNGSLPVLRLEWLLTLPWCSAFRAPRPEPMIKTQPHRHS